MKFITFSRIFLPSSTLKSTYIEEVTSVVISVKNLGEENIKIHDRSFCFDVRKTLKKNIVQMPILQVFSRRKDQKKILSPAFYGKWLIDLDCFYIFFLRLKYI